ncbi:hypothetical protein ACIQLG_19825 [Terribacillus saccharophilus]|uniref:hypothetical protein n=1 Tax=Terribacillus saccharophilus TaxID=361277 RepID=UPI0038064EFB
MYLVQTRTVSNQRGLLNQAFENAFRGLEQWRNNSQWDTEEEATEKAVKIIESGLYPASHVRVLKEVATFKASSIEKVGVE